MNLLRPALSILIVGCVAPVIAQGPLPGLPANETTVTASGDPKISNCTVDLVDTIELPAPEAGVLVFQGVKEGAGVKSEDVIAKIDVSMQEMEKKIAIYEYNAAVKRAKDDIEIRYSRKASDVAKAEHEELLDAESRVPGVIPDPQMRKAKLDWERSILAIDKAGNDMKLAHLDALVARAKVDAADLAIQRRTVLAPFDGQVVEVYRHQQEWVNPGDPILRLVRMDTLRVDAWVFLADHSPREIDGCEVTIEALGPKGKVERATGRITYIRPILTRGGRSQKMMVRAEIANRTVDGQWLIWPNMTASMTIHLGTGGASVGQR